MLYVIFCGIEKMIKITGNNKLLCVCKTLKNAFEFLDVVKPKDEVIVLIMDKKKWKMMTLTMNLMPYMTE